MKSAGYHVQPDISKLRGHPFMMSKKRDFWPPPVHMPPHEPCGRQQAIDMKYT